MDDISNNTQDTNNVKEIFVAQMDTSSEEPPMSEWSSLEIEVPQENKKKLLYGQGLYDPGSGEVCAKYIAMSRSSILRHPYFNYPAVLDPGIQDALLEPEETVKYPDDGQQKYLDVCNEMGQCPVTSFHRGLLTDSINLSYYCVHPYGVRAMAEALIHNKTVSSLNLTDNFLNDDACYHLGEMLATNNTLKELNLSGCRIGPSGAKRLFSGLILNSGLKTLNLNRNALGDRGVEYLADVVERGIDVERISLSYNNISGKSAGILASALEFSNKFSHIDLSWNSLYEPIEGAVSLLTRLGESEELLELNLSWNSLYGEEIGAALGKTLNASNLRVLDLSNNRLANNAVINLIQSVRKTKNLVTLDLSYNPMAPQDAFAVLQKMRLKKVKIQNLLMDNVGISGAFLKRLNEIKKYKFRSNMRVTHGTIVEGYDIAGPDMRDLVLNRAEYLSQRKKKSKVDVALFVLELAKQNITIMDTKDFTAALEAARVPLDKDLIEEICNAFPGPRTARSTSINIQNLTEYVQRKWPDRKLPPTPPPEPELPPPSLVVKKGDKKKKGAKKGVKGAKKGGKKKK
ncbi:protein NLRC3-like [Aricia agestis]|uniref:protein NLRC3-like n=1 Tax=Aricia agestis TaxID=91739 RepID=UPI001C20A7B6|nr:protein NLRC3-like [Aricia agestis]